MALKANKKIILCKIETAYGEDAAPVVTTDAMSVLNFNCNAANVRYIERNQALPYFGNRGQIAVGETMTMQFDLEMAGAGAVATKPGYGPILRACGMSETITPTTGPVTYAPISSGEESATLWFNWDGLMHKMVGAYGTTELKFQEGQVPLINCSLEGLISSITDTSVGSPVLTAFQQAKAMTKANTTFTIHGYAAPLASMTVTQGSQNEYKNRPNSEKMHYVGRSTKGQVTIELPLIAVKDFIGICRAGTTGVIALTHGTIAGQKVIFNAGQVQLTNPRYSEDTNMAMLTMDMNFRHTDAGNDEWTLATQ
jgi:hypothetical protein